MNTIKKIVQHLGEEVDYWKARAENFEQLYESEQEKFQQRISQDIEQSKMNVANLMMLAESLQEQPDGSFILSAQYRKMLVERWCIMDGYRIVKLLILRMIVGRKRFIALSGRWTAKACRSGNGWSRHWTLATFF